MIAGGGDGTINEVSTALIQSQGGNIPALGILPLGTANDFATSVGIPDDLDKALKLAIAANATAIDMVQVNDKTCFINMATGDLARASPPKRQKNSRPHWAVYHILFTD